MSLCVQLQLDDVPVLVIGGGKVALRKCLQMKAEGARVVALAEQFEEGFAREDICCIQDTYHKEQLHGYMLVIACGKDPVQNMQICVDARAMGIFAMNVQQSESASMHAMAYEETQDYLIAFSSKGASPALSKQIVHTLDADIQKHYASRIALLRSIRSYALAHLPQDARCTLLQLVPSFPLRDLIALDQALQGNDLLLFCFHGVRLDATKELQQFVNIMQKHLPTNALGVAYLCDAIIRQSDAIGIAQWKKALDCLQISATLVPMLFQDGNYYRMLCRNSSDNTKLLPILFQDVSAVEDCLKQILQEQACSSLLVIYHSSKDGAFSKLMQTITKRNPHIAALHGTYGNHAALPFHNETVAVFPLYMLKGTHYQKDSHMDSAIVKQLQKQHCTVSILQTSCMEQVPFQTLVVKQIQAYLAGKNPVF